MKSPNHVAILLNGCNSALPIVPGVKLPSSFSNTQAPGITEGVDEEFVRDWLERHQDLKFVRAGLIQILPNKATEAKAVVSDLTTMPTGAAEPLDRTKLPRGILPADPKPTGNAW